MEGQAKLSSELSKAEVVDFINYFLCLHKYVTSGRQMCVHLRVCVWPRNGLLMRVLVCPDSKKQEKQSLVSVVADLRQASLSTTRFIAETLLLLEVLSLQLLACSIFSVGALIDGSFKIWMVKV